MKRILKWVGLALLALVAVLLINTFRLSPQPVTQAPGSAFEVDAQAVAARVSQAVQIRTVSKADPREDGIAPANVRDVAEFARFIAWLDGAYPLAHSVMTREIVNEYGLLFVWEGKNPDLQPVLFTGHYDVVPIDQGSADKWTHPPFSGAIADGFVWGRGTLDDKGQILTMLEAAQVLMAQGFQPERSIHFAFGYDEEIGGNDGAGQIAAHVKAKGIQYAWALDEGSMVFQDVLPGIEPRVASINIAEKGTVTVELTANAQGGHSSLPPPDAAVGSLARGLVNLTSNQVPGGLSGMTGDFFDGIAGHMPFVQRMLFANRWAFGPLLEGELAKSAATNALMRTTTAPTMLSGSPKENVLPAKATAIVNFRIHPRDTIDSVVAHVHGHVDAEGLDVAVQPGPVAPSPVSDAKGEGFEILANTVRKVFDNVIVVPGLTIAITDTRHWGKVSDNTYRFTPFVFTGEDIPRLHGFNERVSIENLEMAVKFYAEVMSGL